MATSHRRMTPSRHLIAEILGGVGIAGVLGLAVQWGALTEQVTAHTDPARHQAIVLAGAVETGQKISAIETEIAVVKTTVESVKEDIAEGKADREQVKRDVSETKGDVKVLLEMQRRLLDLQERSADSGGGP